MDPLTALGLVCNVLDLVNRAANCGKTVHKLHKDGFTDDQADLEAIADTMEEVVTGLLQKAPNNASGGKSALDQETAKLLTKSTLLCIDLRDLVKKCRPETKGSWRSAGVAALVKLVRKSEIESLKTDLETCRSSLTAVLSAATQYGSSLLWPV
jgi:hypothetical protein